MRHTIRSLAAHPGLSLITIGTLAVALAFAVASVALLEGLLLRPYPYPQLREVLLVRDAKPREGAHQGRSIASGDFLDARRSLGAFASLVAWRPQPVVITSAAAEPERVQSIAATANFFTTLGITPMAGRSFSPDADTPGHDGVVLLSRRLWQSRFGGERAIVGRDIGLNGRPMTVIGIVNDDDCYPPGVDAWVPLVITPAEIADRASQRVAALGRLAHGSTEAEAAGQLDALAKTLAARYPSTNLGRGFELLPLQREQYEFTAPLFLFVVAAAALVLLLAVVNVSGLLVARTLDRRHELAVRTMLGASAGRVASVTIAEVLVLTTPATVLGLLLSNGVVSGVRASLPEGIARWIAGWSSLSVDANAIVSGLGVGLLVAAAIGTMVGLASLRATRAVGDGVRVTRYTTWGRRLLVASEVGLAAALLLAASVMVTGFSRIAAAFETLAPAQLLKFTVTLPELRYPDATHIASFHRALLDRVRALPAVERVALIRNEPASNVPNPIVPFDRDDAPAPRVSERPRIDVEVVSPEVFETLRLDVLAGRALTDADGIESSRVAVVSRTAARRFWPDRNPVNTVIRLGTDAQPVRIVGVVSDFILNWYDPERRPILFLPAAQSPARTTSVIVRTHADPLSLARPVRAAVAQLDDRQPLTELEPLSTTIADSLSPIRVIQRLLLIGAALAAALAALGIYGVLAHWVTARRRELGVRVALGATRVAIARLVVREAVLTAGCGIVAGLALAIALVRFADRALLGVPSLTAGSALIVVACAIGLTLAAAVGPAKRAARVDVAELLRSE